MREGNGIGSGDRHRSRSFGRAPWVGWVLAVAAVGCAAEPDAANLKTSFVAQVRAVAGTSEVAFADDVLTFTHPNADGDPVRWRVTIDAVSLDPRPDPRMPVQGHVVSSWYADGERIDPIGSMARLPQAIQDRGVAQECWAFWDVETEGWDW